MCDLCKCCSLLDGGDQCCFSERSPLEKNNSWHVVAIMIPTTILSWKTRAIYVCTWICIPVIEWVTTSQRHPYYDHMMIACYICNFGRLYFSAISGKIAFSSLWRLLLPASFFSHNYAHFFVTSVFWKLWPNGVFFTALVQDVQRAFFVQNDLALQQQMKSCLFHQPAEISQPLTGTFCFSF